MRKRKRKMEEYNKLSIATGVNVEYIESLDDELSWIAKSSKAYHCTDFINSDSCCVGDNITLKPSSDGLLGKGVYVEFFEPDTTWGNTIITILNGNFRTFTEFGTWGVVRENIQCKVVEIKDNEIIVVLN